MPLSRQWFAACEGIMHNQRIGQLHVKSNGPKHVQTLPKHSRQTNDCLVHYAPFGFSPDWNVCTVQGISALHTLDSWLSAYSNDFVEDN